MNSKTQLRGHCQACAREQAVLASGRIAKHGYTVRDGWFSGACPGDRAAPLEHDNSYLAQVLAEVGTQVHVTLPTRIARLQAGIETPVSVEKLDVSDRPARRAPRFETVMVGWAEASEAERAAGVKKAVNATRLRIASGEEFLRVMPDVAAKYVGKPLLTVGVEAGPAPIKVGEKRTYRGRVVAASDMSGGRVFFQVGAGARGFVTTRAWRLLPLA